MHGVTEALETKLEQLERIKETKIWYITLLQGRRTDEIYIKSRCNGRFETTAFPGKD